MNDIARSRYEIWKSRVSDRELFSLLDTLSDTEIEDAFTSELAFGTGGLRGTIGVGTNRMNIYMVRKATQGLADYLNSSDLPKSAAIAYDSRIKSDVFAAEAASVLAANGISVHIYPRLEPTPALSWAVRYFSCGAGICITASHNPAAYNGYKVYGPDGCQITNEAADAITRFIGAVDCFDGVHTLALDEAVGKGLVKYNSDSVLSEFIDAVLKNSVITGKCDNLKLVYTPLCGSGLEPVRMLLERIGVSDVTVVPAQEKPDGSFPTCPYPNPEIQEAMMEGLKLCDKVQPDLLIGTDPDCDRCGIAVRADDGSYKLITGNELGLIMLDFICRERIASGTMPASPVAVTTIVSTDMADAVAEHYGVELRRTLTGFKYIGEQIGLLEKDGEAGRFIFGFEESYGYLSGSHVRDKDAVNAVMLVCQAASYYKKRGKSLLNVLNALYAEYGFYKNGLAVFSFPGEAGMRTMKALMDKLRTEPPKSVAGKAVISVADYKGGSTGLPSADVLEFALEGKAKVMVRPSGTEPKLKMYLSVRGGTESDADGILKALMSACGELTKI